MALPFVHSFADCADYSRTVEPFIPQLYRLPYGLLGHIGSLDGLRAVYLQTNPLISAFAVSLFLGIVFLIASEINKNYSQVDRMWSILPNLYVVHFAVWSRCAGLPHERIDLAAAATTLWSIRLTYNYWRRGGYNVGSEDYRWEILQKYVNRFVWFIFNVTFISFIQTVLLLAFSGAPAYPIMLSSKLQPSLTVVDKTFFAIMVSLVLTEWWTDGQQWKYYTAKYEYKDSGKVTGGFTKADLERGFNTSGLFAYSRHPNFLAEQMFWFVLYQWSCYATSSLYSWAGAGSMSLFLLFQGSTLLTELISSGKYPEYKEYQKQVGMFMPKSTEPYKAPASAKKRQ